MLMVFFKGPKLEMKLWDEVKPLEVTELVKDEIHSKK